MFMTSLLATLLRREGIGRYNIGTPMSEFLKMDIFFVVTTIVTVVAGVFIVIALYYVVRILRSVDHLAQNVSTESDNIKEDLLLLRTKLREEGTKIKHFSDYFAGIVRRKQARRKAVREE